ncbi:hypothetical protein ACHAWT_006728 [Skeletonema menzelii]
MPVLLIDYMWYHAVNDQQKLSSAVTSVKQNEHKVHAIEADIIYSEEKGQSVMGHPPQVDGELTLSSLLHQVHESNFQSAKTDAEANILKLDFKSMKALKSSIDDVQNYLKDLPHRLHQHVWINADILAGPGGGEGEDMRPKFDAVEFMDLLTAQSSMMKSTTLSIGWTTSLTDMHAPYTLDMINEMLTLLRPYPERNITFPIRSTSFRHSWAALRNLYDNDVDKQKKWTLTLWWSLTSERHKMTEDEMNWIHGLLESDTQSVLSNRTYYDLVNFSPP